MHAHSDIGATPGRVPGLEDKLSLPTGSQFTDLIARSMDEGLCAFDVHGCIAFSNPSAQRMLGWTEPELCGRNIHDVVHGDAVADCRRDRCPVLAVLDSAQPTRRHTDAFARRDGSTFPVAYTAAPLVQDGQVAGAVLTFHDITELRRTQDQYQKLNETLEQRVAERTAQAEQRAMQLQWMARELAAAEQRERRRVAQFLHDHIQQLLVAVRMRLGAIRWPADAAQAEAARKADELLTEAIHAARSLSMEVAPPVLYEFGFAAALQWLARWASDKYGLRVDLQTRSSDDIPDEQLRVTVFDAVRELLLNVVKHAGVDTARLLVETDDTQLRIAVVDRGRGFDTDQLRSRKAGTGHGLLSFEERLRVMGVRVTIHSAPARGTRVELAVPCQPYGSQADPARPEASPATAPPPDDHDLVADPLATPRRARVLLIDDHATVRQGLAQLIDQHASMEVVGQASTGEDGIELARQLKPDVVVMDISLPGISGLEAARHIKQDVPESHIVGLSMHEERDVAERLRAVGASGFFSKAQPADELIAAICHLTSQPRPNPRHP